MPAFSKRSESLMVDDKEMPYFIQITAVNPLLSHKTELESLVNSLTRKKAWMVTLLVQWIFNYSKQSDTTTKDMTEKPTSNNFISF